MSDYRKGPRRRHSDEFKMEVVKACGGPDVSGAAVALSFGVNANLARQWLRGRGFKREGVAGARRGIAVEAAGGSSQLRCMAARAAAVIRIDAMWLACAPVDMRVGADRLLAAVVHVFGAAQAHHGYLFANARCTRSIKVASRERRRAPRRRCS